MRLAHDDRHGVQAARHGLAERDEVGLHAGLGLVREVGARAAEAGLDFVADEEDVVGVAEGLDGGEVARWGDAGAGGWTVSWAGVGWGACGGAETDPERPWIGSIMKAAMRWPSCSNVSRSTSNSPYSISFCVEGARGPTWGTCLPKSVTGQLLFEFFVWAGTYCPQ